MDGMDESREKSSVASSVERCPLNGKNGMDKCETKTSICDRFRQDEDYRKRLFHTACTTWAMLSSGASHTLVGLAFPDLMVLIKRDLAEASWIFTTWSFGNMLGSLLSGFAYDRLNKLLVLVFLPLGLAVATGTTPWCTSFPLMLIVHLIGGGFASAIHSTVTADTIYLWKTEKITYLQIVHLAATAGGILSPFFVNPFLSRLDQVTSETNATFHTTNESGLYLQVVDNSTSSSDMPSPIQQNESKLHYAYLLSAGFTLIAVVLYMLVRAFSGNVYSKTTIEHNSTTTADDIDNIHKAFTKKTVLFFVFLVSVQIMFFVTMQRHEFGLFMTYAIKEFKWSKKKTSNTLAVFWCVFCLGRVVAVFALRLFREDNLNWCYMIVMSLGVIGLSVSSLLHISIAIIIFLNVSAFGMAPLFTFMLSWFSSHITLVTGRITGVVYVFMAIGSMLVPAISGHLMDNVSYNWYLYVLVILLLLYVFFTIFLRFSYRKLKYERGIGSYD